MVYCASILKQMDFSPSVQCKSFLYWLHSTTASCWIYRHRNWSQRMIFHFFEILSRRQMEVLTYHGPTFLWAKDAGWQKEDKSLQLLLLTQSWDHLQMLPLVTLGVLFFNKNSCSSTTVSATMKNYSSLTTHCNFWEKKIIFIGVKRTSWDTSLSYLVQRIFSKIIRFCS